MKVYSPLRLYGFLVFVSIIIIVVILNAFRILPFGDAGTVIGILVSSIAVFINLIKLTIEKKDLYQQYKINVEKIEAMLDYAASRDLPHIISSAFSAKQSEFKQMGLKLKKDITRRYMKNFKEEKIEKDISKSYVNFFIKICGNKLKNETENFIYYLIYDTFNYLKYASEIYSFYLEESKGNNFFSALFTAYFHQHVQDDFHKLLREAKNILKNKISPPSEKEILKKLPDSNKIKLGSYIVNSLRKNLSFTTYLEAIKNIQAINQSFLIILGEKESGQDEKIFTKLVREGKVISITNTRLEKVFFVVSVKNHKDIHEFLEKEILNGIPKNHRYVLLATRIFPNEVDYVHHGEVQAYYQKLKKSATQIHFNEKKLGDLLKIVGKPIAELIDNATIDFFVSGDVYLFESERIDLATHSKEIYQELKDLRNMPLVGIIEVLEITTKAALTNVLCKYCKFNKNRADQIVKSIKQNIVSWREIVFKTGG